MTIEILGWMSIGGISYKAIERFFRLIFDLYESKRAREHERKKLLLEASVKLETTTLGDTERRYYRGELKQTYSTLAYLWENDGMAWDKAKLKEESERVPSQPEGR